MSDILLTGATGFLGKCYKIIWDKSNLRVTGISRRSEDITCDLSLEVPKLPHRFDYVVHCAGKAHDQNAQLTDFEHGNIRPTLNLLKALEQNPPRSIIFISSVAVYGRESGIDISEATVPHPNTPYGKTKLCAENMILDWCATQNISGLILRLPLVAGPNPPGNLRTMVHGLESGRYLRIGKGSARRSIVWAEDIAQWLPTVWGKSGTYNLTGATNPCFRELEDAICEYHNFHSPISIPQSIAGTLAHTLGRIPGFPLSLYRYRKMTQTLTFSSEKARKELNWNPVDVVRRIREKGL